LGEDPADAGTGFNQHQREVFATRLAHTGRHHPNANPCNGQQLFSEWGMQRDWHDVRQAMVVKALF
jgi:hypothetical protein